jgi:hypothetical protein
VWGLSNAGDRGSVVLNHFREAGVGFIETGEGDDTLGLFEYSAEDDCDLLDRRQWAQANPALGHGGITEATLLSKSRLPPALFRTEHLCQGVLTLKPAFDKLAWQAGVDQHGTLDGLRSRIAVCDRGVGGPRARHPRRGRPTRRRPHPRRGRGGLVVGAGRPH